MIAPDHTQISRLVVRAPNWLGDAVLVLPAMAALRRHFASAHLTVAAPSSVAALFHEQTDVRPDTVLALPSDNRAANPLHWMWGEAPALPSSITLIVGLPRPQTAETRTRRPGSSARSSTKSQHRPARR